MDKNPLLKHLMKDKTADVAHSSAYAKAQNSSFGVSSTESFAKRREIDQNRSVVRGYGDAKIVRDGLNNGPRPKTYEKQDSVINDSNNEKPAQSSIKQRLDSTPSVTPSASSSTQRKYSPQIRPNIKPKI